MDTLVLSAAKKVSLQKKKVNHQLPRDSNYSDVKKKALLFLEDIESKIAWGLKTHFPS